MEESRRLAALSDEFIASMRRDLPDSRIRDRKPVKLGGMLFDRCFCVNCGADGGLVHAGTPFILYLCEPCAATYGRLPLPEIPEEAVRGTANLIPCG